MEQKHNEFGLEETDALYFLHIPKTAGTTFISILDNFFDFNSICKKQSWDNLLPDMPSNLSKYNLFRGHFGYSLYRILLKPPIFITML